MKTNHHQLSTMIMQEKFPLLSKFQLFTKTKRQVYMVVKTSLQITWYDGTLKAASVLPKSFILKIAVSGGFVHDTFLNEFSQRSECLVEMGRKLKYR